MFAVIIHEKGGQPRRQEFTKSEVTIGRVQGNDIILPKQNVSKRHSRIVVKDGKFIIVDLKSTNGTYVNGRKIASPMVIKQSDKIYIGDFILSVEPLDGEMMGDDDEAAPPASDIRSGRGMPSAPAAAMPLAPPPPPPPRPIEAPRPVAEARPIEPPARPVEPARPEPIARSVEAPARPPEPRALEPRPVEAARPVPLAPPPVLQSSTAQQPPPPPRMEPPPARVPAAAPIVPAALAATPEPVAMPAPVFAPAMPAPVPVSDEAGHALGVAFGKAHGYVLQQRIALPTTWSPGDVEDANLRKRLEAVVRDALRGMSLPAGFDQRIATDSVLAELLAAGPFEALLADRSVERIFANGTRGVIAVRGGQSIAAGRFSSATAGQLVARRLLAGVGIEGDAPFAEGWLADGTRIHIAFSAMGGPAFTLDRPRPAASLAALVDADVLSPNMAAFLNQAMVSGRKLVIASNDVEVRLELMGALLGQLSPQLRVVAVEGGGRLPAGNHVQLSGAPGVSHADLVRQAVKMRPDRLVLADARGEDTYVALSALSGAVNGGIIGLDAESTDDALIRLVRQASLAVKADEGPLEGLVRESVDILVQVLRYADGRVSVTQIVDVDGEVQDVFTGLGGFRATGHIPRWVSNAQSLGHPVDLNIFR